MFDSLQHFWLSCDGVILDGWAGLRSFPFIIVFPRYSRGWVEMTTYFYGGVDTRPVHSAMRGRGACEAVITFPVLVDGLSQFSTPSAFWVTPLCPE